MDLMENWWKNDSLVMFFRHLKYEVWVIGTHIHKKTYLLLYLKLFLEKWTAENSLVLYESLYSRMQYMETWKKCTQHFSIFFVTLLIMKSLYIFLWVYLFREVNCSCYCIINTLMKLVLQWNFSTWL